MNAADFRDLKAGRVVQGSGGYAAFVPAPLPPDMKYDNRLVMALSQADTALSELSGLGRNLPNPHLLINPYIRREAVLSSRIEGTHTTLSGLLLDEVNESVLHRDDADLREVRNYVMALEHGIDQLGTLSLSLRMVRDLHARLLEGVRGENQTPGEFRRVQNIVGPRGCDEFTAPYVPPPVGYLDECLHNWEWFAHERDVMPDLIQCAVLHEQFEAIHPFGDGNGRLGRLLIILFLLDRGRLSQPLLYPSAYIESHKDTYYDTLQSVRTDGDWVGWISFFLTVITESAGAGVRQASRLMDLRENSRRELRDNLNALTLLDELFINPYMTFPRAMRVLGVSNPTARRAVTALEKMGMLHKIGARQYRQLFAAMPILRVIAPEDPIAADEGA